MKKALLLLLVLAGCSSDNSPPVIIPPQPPANGGWFFQFSPGMTVPQAYGNGGFTFSFPSTDGVHYLAKPQGTPLGGAISITYSIDASPGAVFDYRTAADNTCGPGFPGTVTPYVHAANDSAFQSEFGRWFGVGFKQELVAGSFMIGAPFYSDPSLWVSVYGKNGKDYLAQFQGALANVAEVGLTFGGGCFLPVTASL